MPGPLSMDLRWRIVDAVEAGGTVRGVAARFAVSPSSVSNISRLWRATGSAVPKPTGGDRRSHVTEAHGERIPGFVSETPDVTLDEIRTASSAEGVEVGRISIRRFLDRHGLSFKKNGARRRAATRRRDRVPTWPALEAGLRAANAWSPRCLVAIGRRPPS